MAQLFRNEKRRNRVQVYFSDEEIKVIVAEAKALDISESAMCRALIRIGLAHSNKETKKRV